MDVESNFLLFKDQAVWPEKEKLNIMQKKLRQTKIGRQRYFKVSINAGLRGPRLNLLNSNIDSLADILTTFQFISQKKLETILDDLVIHDRGRDINLKNFDGQLEQQPENGIPFWSIGLETKILTTSRCIARALTQELFDTSNTIDSTITVYACDDFQKSHRNNRLILPNTKWYPGYINKTTMKLVSILQTSEVQESLRETPERYENLIPRLMLESKK